MILCFDIGGSRIKAALADFGETVTDLGDTPTPRDDFAAFSAALARFAVGRNLRGVAIAIAGGVDPDTGRITVANIPCANGRVLADDLAAALHLPVVIVNDADAFALAESRQGAGRGARNVFGVILGTGVGGGLVIDGRLITGAGGFAGEWGHGPIIADPAFACGCGQVGCVDTVGGARGIERLHGTGMTAPDIVRAWQAGDAAAGRTVDLWLRLLAPPLAMVVNTVGAHVVPVGGGLGKSAPLVAALDAAVRGMILRQMDRPLLVPAEIAPEPGLIGAAWAGRAAWA